MNVNKWNMLWIKSFQILSIYSSEEKLTYMEFVILELMYYFLYWKLSLF